VIAAYLDELRHELRRVGVDGRAAGRLLSEAREHLRDLEGDAARFGAPEDIARAAAAELAVARTRFAAYVGFAVLVVVGIAYLAFVALAGGNAPPDFTGGESAALGVLATVGLVLFPQVAFVTGCLTLVRDVRLRRVGVVGSAELGLLRRRTAVAVISGMLTIASAALWAFEFRDDVKAWPVLLGCALLALPLAASLVGVRRSARPSAAPGDASGDVFDDLPLLARLGLDRGGRLAGATAAFVGAVGFTGGWVAEGDPGSGLVRGGFEAVALLGCYVVLAGPLALRRASDA
jgi:hypothetical protein